MRLPVPNIAVALAILIVAFAGCEAQPPRTRSRAEAIPANAPKIRPEADPFPPVLHEEAWSVPENLGPTVNSAGNEDQPYLSPDGRELWFTGTSRLGYPGPAVFRSVRAADGWSAPVEIVSQFAGEPTLDAQGNLYFVHHFFDTDGNMIEADIYVAYRK